MAADFRWDYRTVRRVRDGVESYTIREVYYDDSGAPLAFAEAEPTGETPADLRNVLHWMLDALGQPVLDEADLWQQCRDNPIWRTSDADGLEPFRAAMRLLGWDDDAAP
jgi:hypothetical protein